MFIEESCVDLDPSSLIRQVEDNTRKILGSLAINDSDSNVYVNYIMGSESPAQEYQRVLSVSDTLRNTYNNNLGRYRKSVDEYDCVEQIMLGHIFGRTKLDAPRTVPASVELMAETTYKSDNRAIFALSALISGLDKFHRRINR